MQKTFYVYILSGQVRRPLHRHDQQPHPSPLGAPTKAPRKLHQKVQRSKASWFELHAGPKSAIEREKEIKAWRRSKKSSPDSNHESSMARPIGSISVIAPHSLSLALSRHSEQSEESLRHYVGLRCSATPPQPLGSFFFAVAHVVIPNK